MLAHRIKPDACGLYYLGSFAPDAFSDDRADKNTAKNKNHFRDVPDAEAALAGFYSRIDRKDPFHEGYFVHLMCDMLYGEFCDRYTKDKEWGSIYGEYRAAGIWIRRNLPWVADVFNKLKNCPDEFKNPAADPASEEIINYKNGLLSPSVRINDENSDGKPSEVFTPEFLESYADEIAGKYKSWIKNK
jgi:hypothetical protein